MNITEVLGGLNAKMPDPVTPAEGQETALEAFRSTHPYVLLEYHIQKPWGSIPFLLPDQPRLLREEWNISYLHHAHCIYEYFFLLQG